ncbi:BREX-1 system adenine-specific DNA-methyltransferase PglX [Pseudomonas sp. B21128]|uniref:BREX-1 system adenine-specific DNA-methyltransferase PglX n=1 Tax=Pseudomonas sp. B21128 TaxID=3235110 RepID=UPI003782E6DF
MSQENQKKMEQHFFRGSAADFKKIPGSPIAYWVSPKSADLFESFERLGSYSDIKTGMQTGDNEKFLRLWPEVSASCINRPNAELGGGRWHLYSKGGDFRRWYGNVEHVVDWKNDGNEIKTLKVNGSLRSRVRDLSNYCLKAASWSFVSSASFGCRYKEPGVFFDVAGSCALEKSTPIEQVLGFLCSKLSSVFLNALNPTLNFQIQDISNLPYRSIISGVTEVKQLIDISKNDWDSYETSSNFTSQPLLTLDFHQPNLKQTYQKLRVRWLAITQKMQRLEEENNRIFIEAYGLQDELTPEVPLKEITLTCNPHYRYGDDKTEIDLEAQLQSDTMAEFLSYAVACMFGRYSLDKPGLVLANQGDTLAEYLRQIPEPRFMPDEDNVIPLLDGEWFADEVTERFRTFLRVTFGEAHYEANLAFIEQSLGKDVRKYFLKDFYADHVKRYKKRPIYWLFSSPKGTFNALIYLHRYRPDTVSVVLRYLRDFRKKLAARLDYLQQVGISTSASQGEKTRALKEIETLKKQLLELDDYERDTLYPLATEQVALDLDDGVKVNYLKLGSALKKIIGLDAKED